MKQQLDQVVRWPYSPMDYTRRIAWGIFKYTLWKFLWHRFYSLRMLSLQLFGADVSLKSMAHGSTDILRPWDVHLGEYVALGPRVRLYNLNKISIGDHTVISQDAYLCGGTHDYTDATMPLLRRDIVIGKNVWICAGAFIGPGITIGDGAVIGARAVVMKDVKAWTVVSGNPAQFIKNREIKK